MSAPSDPPSDRVLHVRRAIGRNIATARLRQNLTQEALAETTGISRDSIYRTELGVRSARLDWLILISDALGVDLSDLVRRGE